MHTPPSRDKLSIPTVVILAAGRGNRMRPLTESTPKPLLTIDGVSLLDRHLASLDQGLGFLVSESASAQKLRVVVNVAHLGDQLIEHMAQATQEGNYPNLQLRTSDERAFGALETAGGVINALPLLDHEALLIINGDVYTNLDFSAFWLRATQALESAHAYLGLVKNPSHNIDGDYNLAPNGHLSLSDVDARLTFSGISAFRKSVFEGCPTEDKTPTPLAPLLKELIKQDLVKGELLAAAWTDVGTPERLEELNQNSSGTVALR